MLTVLLYQSIWCPVSQCQTARNATDFHLAVSAVIICRLHEFETSQHEVSLILTGTTNMYQSPDTGELALPPLQKSSTLLHVD